MADHAREHHDEVVNTSRAGQANEEAQDIAPLEAVLATHEFRQRPARAPDYANETAALVALITALADAPQSILQILTETALNMTQAGSAGISLLSKDDKSFFWPAIAGRWRPHVGGGTPR